MKTPPVVLFIYRRPDLTRRVLERINRASPARLYVISDGPKSTAEVELVRLARLCVDEFQWECEVLHVYSSQNLGLRDRVLSGLDYVFNIEEEAIILEDDCLPSDSFFKFVSGGLQAYRNHKSVSLVSGSSPDTPNWLPEVYFTLDSPIWGWGTWRSSWNEFRAGSRGQDFSEDEIEEIAKTVQGVFAKRRFRNFLRSSKNLDSWAIEFASYNRLNNRLSAVSGVNLVENIGFGEGSTHTKFESFVDQSPALELDLTPHFPEKVCRDLRLERSISRHRMAKWVAYPLKHPLDVAVRLLRFARLVFFRA